MLGLIEGAEDVGDLKTINEINSINESKMALKNNEKNLARLARYYRSSSLINEDESEETSSPENPRDLMPTESRLLSRSHELEPSEYDDGSETGNDETEVLKKKEIQLKGESNSASSTPHMSPVSQAYSLPTNYEYPELVQSLKSVYKEMFITGGLYLLNIISAVGIVLVNKYIYTHYKFTHGLVLTLYHFILTSIGLQILAAMQFFPIKPVKLIKIVPLSVSFCSYVVLTNLSLQYNSGTFYQVKLVKM